MLVDFLEGDDEVLIPKEIKLQIGQFCHVEITGAEEFDLWGKVCL